MNTRLMDKFQRLNGWQRIGIEVSGTAEDRHRGVGILGNRQFNFRAHRHAKQSRLRLR
jgi:hypothetical protein